MNPISKFILKHKIKRTEKVFLVVNKFALDFEEREYDDMVKKQRELNQEIDEMGKLHKLLKKDEQNVVFKFKAYSKKES